MMLEALEKRGIDLYANVSPSRDYWLNAGAGMGGVHYTMIFGKDEVRVEFALNRGTPAKNKAMFDYLHERKEQLEKAFGSPLDWRRLDDNKVSIISFGKEFDGYKRENWPKMVATWAPILDYAKAAGVKIGIENCPMLFSQDEWPGGKNLMTSPAIWRRVFQQFAGYELGLNFDPSHFIWQRMDYLAAIREFAPRFWHCHAKDARLDQDRLDQVGILAHPLEFHTPKLPGLGDVNWGKFFSVLADAGYDGAVCVEVEDRAYEGSLEARKASLVQSFRYLSQFVEPY